MLIELLHLGIYILQEPLDHGLIEQFGIHERLAIVGGDWFGREAGTQLERLARGGERAEGLQVGNGVILVELLNGLLAVRCANKIIDFKNRQTYQVAGATSSLVLTRQLQRQMRQELVLKSMLQHHHLARRQVDCHCR